MQQSTSSAKSVTGSYCNNGSRDVTEPEGALYESRHMVRDWLQKWIPALSIALSLVIEKNLVSGERDMKNGVGALDFCGGLCKKVPNSDTYL